MKTLLNICIIAAVIIVSFYSAEALAQEINVDRIWQEGNYAYALVTFTNTGTRIYKRYVTIECVAYDADGSKLGANTGSFLCHEIGTIKPGFTDTLKIPIELNGGACQHIKCSGRCR
jgi:hypothetical protein